MREAAVEALGELVDLTTEEALKPFVVQVRHASWACGRGNSLSPACYITTSRTHRDAKVN